MFCPEASRARAPADILDRTPRESYTRIISLLSQVEELPVFWQDPNWLPPRPNSIADSGIPNFHP